MIKNCDVIGLGANAIAQIVRLDTHLDAGNRAICPPQNFDLFGGGAMGNTLTFLSRLGMKTGYLGKLGGDHFGILLKQICVNEGIDLSHCEILPDERSAWSWIIVDKDGKHTHIMFPNVLTHVDDTYIQANSYYLKSCRLVHVECSAMPLSSILTAIEIAKSEGILIGLSLDISVKDITKHLRSGTQDDLEEIIFLSDLFMLNVGTARELTGKDDPQEMTEILQEQYQLPSVVVFQGREGCSVTTPEDQFNSQGFAVSTVDDTGAADAFQAGMIFGILQDWTIRDSARFANACSAICASKFGPRKGAFTEEDVQQFLKTHS